MEVWRQAAFTGLILFSLVSFCKTALSSDVSSEERCLHAVDGVCTCCRTGWRGDNCTVSCPTCGYNNLTGTCSSFCINATYGEKCQLKCPGKCKHGEIQSFCDRVNGSCNHGCLDGYFGTNCTDKCSKNCLNGRCDQKTGQCEKCDLNRYGPQCDYNCSPVCEGKCGDDNGLCECKDARKGSSCKFHCKYHCDTTNCLNSNFQCPAECPAGSAGPMCLDLCLQECKQKCDRVTGTCVDSQHNVTGDTKTRNNAPSRCPANSFMSVCRTDNTCWFCNLGWYGQKCDTPCFHCPWGCIKDTGECLRCRYGDNCTHPCPSSCRAGPQGEAICDPASGVCFYGCKTGNTGPECVLGARATHHGTTDTNKESGNVNAGVVIGIVVAVLVVVAVVVVVVVVVHKKRTRRRCGGASSLPSTHDEDLGLAAATSTPMLNHDQRTPGIFPT